MDEIFRFDLYMLTFGHIRIAQASMPLLPLCGTRARRWPNRHTTQLYVHCLRQCDKCTVTDFLALESGSILTNASCPTLTHRDARRSRESW
eukprot:6471247-Amphidinium_carterae.1